MPIRGLPSRATLRLLVLASLWICGCEVVGPAALRSGRPNYNEAIQRTDKEQLRLNIVRLRFIDRPYFLELSTISSTTEGSVFFGGNQKETGVGGGFRERTPPRR
jgi:hypothetical protein